MLELQLETIMYKCTEFIELDAVSLAEVLTFDELYVTEEDLYDGVMRWLHHDLPTRCQLLYDVMSRLRFTLMDEHFFYDQVKSSALFKADGRLQKLFDEVIR